MYYPLLDYLLLIAAPAAPAWFVYGWQSRCSFAQRAHRLRRALVTYGASCLVAASLSYTLARQAPLESSPMVDTWISSPTTAVWMGPDIIGTTP